MKSIRPTVWENAHDASKHLTEHGWTVIKVMDRSTAERLKRSMQRDVGFFDDFDDDPFHPYISRILGGMLKTHHLSMCRSAHTLRKKVRSTFFDVLRCLPFPDKYLDFPIPQNEEELSCNPDAIYISSGDEFVLPKSISEARKVTNNDNLRDDENNLLWWHVDTNREKSFLQSSVVLQNPKGSEEFAVYDKSHLHFDCLDSRREGFQLLNDNDIEELEKVGCEPLSIRVPRGSMILWFSSTVHTIRPFKNANLPRMLSYVCFGTIHHLSVDELLWLRRQKSLAILFGGTCGHTPYPCSVNWQNGRVGWFRDVIPYYEIPHVIFGSRKKDYTDRELSIYGLTVEDLREAILHFSQTWDPSLKIHWDFLL